MDRGIRQEQRAGLGERKTCFADPRWRPGSALCVPQPLRPLAAVGSTHGTLHVNIIPRVRSVRPALAIAVRAAAVLNQIKAHLPDFLNFMALGCAFVLSKGEGRLRRNTR